MKAFELISISFFSVLLISNALNSKVFAQQLLQSPSAIDNESEHGLNVRITSLIPEEQVPVGNLTIHGTSDYNKTRECTVYVGLNGLLPLRKASANGTEGADDYRDWNYTFSPPYEQIHNGTNKIDSQLTCSASPENLTRTYSLNVTGILNGNLTNQSSPLAITTDEESGSDPGSFTNSTEYKLGSDAFRACIDAAASVGDKLSDYEIQNCRDDPSYRNGIDDYSGSVSGDSVSTSDSGSSSDSSDSSNSGSNSNGDSNSDGSGDGASTNVCNSNGGSNSNNNGTETGDGIFNVGAAGDWSGNSNACKTALNMENKGVDLALGLGDYAYSTGSDGVTSWWDNVMAPLHGIFRGALGNHDTQDKGDYAHAFGQSGPWFYSFNKHGIHFLALDLYSPFGSGSTQYKFVSDDLASASVDPSIKWIIVFFHEPMYTSPSHHPPVESLRNTYHPLFDKYGVDMVLQGHNHNYQRTYPLSYNPESSSNPTVTSKETQDYDDPEGQIYMEVGTGGQNSYSLDGKSPFVYKQFTTKGGFLNLAFSDSSTLKATFDNNDGTIMDQFSIHKSASKLVPAGKSIYHYNATTTEDTPLLILAHVDKNQSHDPADSLSVIQPQHGSVRINPNKTLTYVPDRNYFGTDTFAYNNAITGGKVKLASKVSIKVIPINDPPVASDDSLEVGSDNNFTAAVNVLANDTDADGDSLSISKVYPSTSPTGGWDVKNVGSGLLSFYGRKELASPESFRYIVTDGNGGSDTGTVILEASKIHKGPSAIDQNLTATNSTNSRSNLNASAPISMYAVKDSDDSLNLTSNPKNTKTNQMLESPSLGKNASSLLEKSGIESKKLMPELLNFETNITLTKQQEISPYPRNLSSHQVEIKMAADQAKIAIAQMQAHFLKKSFDIRVNDEKSKDGPDNTETQQVLKRTLDSKRESLNQQLSKIEIPYITKADDKVEVEKVIQQAQILKEKAETSLRTVYPPEQPSAGSKEKLVDKIGTKSEISSGGTPLTRDDPTLSIQNIKPSPIEHKNSFHTTDHRQSSQKIPGFEPHSIKTNDHGGKEIRKNDQQSNSLDSHIVDRIKTDVPKNHKPHANAGTDQTVFERTSINLDGTKTVDPDGDRLGFTWKQIQGPRVKLLNSHKSLASFIAPNLPSGLDKIPLKFEIIAKDRGTNNMGSSDVVTVVVKKISPHTQPNAELRRTPNIDTTAR